MSARRQLNPITGRQDGAAMRVEATVDQTWALDSEWLHDRIDVLRPYGRHFVNRIRLLDLLCDILILASVISTFFVAWWSGIPLLGFACLQRYANRRMAGELAAKAARESTDAFLYLYNRGALWLD